MQCRRCRFDPGLERSPGEGNGNPRQCFCLGNAMDRGAWWTQQQWLIYNILLVSGIQWFNIYVCCKVITTVKSKVVITYSTTHSDIFFSFGENIISWSIYFFASFSGTLITQLLYIILCCPLKPWFSFHVFQSFFSCQISSTDLSPASLTLYHPHSTV